MTDVDANLIHESAAQDHGRATDLSALKLDCRWYRFDDAPPGSYACIHAPDGEMQGATLSWMPLQRGQIPAEARRGFVCPVPELKSAVAALRAREAQP